MNTETSEYEAFAAMGGTHEVVKSGTDWIPLSDGIDLTEVFSQAGEEKDFNRNKYAKKILARNIAFKKMSPKDQKLIVKIRKEKRVKVNNKAKLDPHMFEEVIGFVGDRIKDANYAKDEAKLALEVARKVNVVQDTLKYPGSDHEDLVGNTAARMEDLIAFIAGIASSGNFINFLSLLHLYLRTFYTESVTLKIIELVTSNFNVAKGFVTERTGIYAWKSQSGLDMVDKVEKQFDLFKKLMKNWKMHKSCDLTKHVCNIINVLVTFGFFPNLQESPLELHGFQLFQAKVWDIQKNSVDFLEMVLDTAIFFLERGYAAIRTGDLSLLLYEDSEAIALEREYALLIAALPLLEAGKLEALERFHESITDQQDFEVRLETLIAKFSGMLKAEKSPYVRNTLQNKLVVLSKLRTNLIMCQKSSCIREKPFGILIHGGSAVGKSMVNSIVLKVLLDANKLNSTKEHVITLNDSDKFQSEYRAHHTAVTMDDFGNTKAEHYDGSPTNKIIDFLNNVPKAALNPNVELKGNIMLQPKLVSVTTNVKTLLASTFSNEPVSILRRFNVVLDVFLRDDFIDSETGGPLESKMAGKFIPSAWLINVEVVKIIRREGKDTYEFSTIKKNATIFEALEIMKTMSAKHFKSQKAFVQIVEEMYTLDLCEHSYPAAECSHCKLHTDIVGLANQAGAAELDKCPGWDPIICENLMELDPVVPPAELEPDTAEMSTFGTLKKIVADWHIERKLDGAVKHTTDACSTLMEAFEKHKSAVLKVTIGTVAVASSIYAIHRLYRMISALNQQGCEVSTPVRIDGDAPSPWKIPRVLNIPKSMASATTTWEDLSEKVSKHIGHIYLIDHKRSVRRKCDIMPMCANFWLAPSHMFEEQEYRVEIQTTPRDVLGKNPTQIVGPENWYRIPGTDYLLICLTSGGDVADFSRFLPTEDYDYPNTFVEGIWKSPDGEVDRDAFKILASTEIESKLARFPGVTYNYPRPTFEGQCMMALVSRTIGPVLVGFHLAGRTGESFGAAGKLLKSQLDDAVVQLRKKGVLACHSSGDMSTLKYGIDFTPTDSLPPKSAVNFLTDAEDGTQPVALVFGEHPLGTRTFLSNVKKSPISDSVLKHTGLERQHGKPSGMNSWTHWQRDLSLMSIPRGNFRPSIMKQARDDFAGMVDSFFDENPAMLELVHPYSKDAVLAGIDAVNSVDRIDLNTSMGFPVNKQKKNFIHDSERVVPGINCPLDVDDQFWDEVERMEEVLAGGERVFTTFRGNLKDEPTKFTKNKVRVFAGCEFAFLCLTRKYFLSIIRVIQSNWDKFECAVGINAHGKDWTKLAENLTRYGSERMIAGDYAAFDKSAAPEAMLASFDQLIRIAERAGYTERQLCIMRGIATEICLPVYEFNGVLLQMFGSNPSGHPLTVIINNVMNSLYLRYAYYVIHDGKSVPPFASRISLMCYGDDNAMGVHDDEKDFNHTRVSQELAKVGIKYTMADKEAESVPYIDFSEVSFLKRFFVWNDDVKQYVAPIEVASISKSLHNFMKRKGSQTLPEAIAGDALKNAQREFFRHGRTIYTERMSQLTRVRDECDLGIYVGDFPTYDEAVIHYLEAASNVKRAIVDEPKVIRFD